MTLKEIWNGLIEDPVKLAKNILWSLDHSQRGFSLKKMSFVYFLVFIITSLYGAYIYYRLRLGQWGEFTLVLPMTLTWAGYLINLNAKQEKDILAASKNIIPNTQA